MSIGKMCKKVHFYYILHWNLKFQRDVVLEIDFVRFRLSELLQESVCRVRMFAARQVDTIV